MDGATANPLGWGAMLAQVSLILIGTISFLVLLSFGGQVVVAPALLPSQWLIARHTRGAVSIAFSVLGALLAAEVAWIGIALLATDGPSPLLLAFAVAAGLCAAFLFFQTSRPKGAA